MVVTLAVSLFLVNQAVADNEAAAQDVWVYTDSDDGTQTYVDDNTLEKVKGSYQRVYCKNVKSDGSWYGYTARFSLDEGHIWAELKYANGRKVTYTIHRAANVNIHHHIDDRPELRAVYNWVNPQRPIMW